MGGGRRGEGKGIGYRGVFWEYVRDDDKMGNIGVKHQVEGMGGVVWVVWQDMGGEAWRRGWGSPLSPAPFLWVHSRAPPRLLACPQRSPCVLGLSGVSDASTGR